MNIPFVDPVDAPLVVIVEDDPLVANALEFVVQDFGYRVCCAASEDAAVARLAELDQVPSLIISDWRLANGRTGGQAIARIRDLHGQDIPALVLTGESSPTRFRDIHDLGLTVFIKPVDLARLREAIESACGRPQPA